MPIPVRSPKDRLNDHLRDVEEHQSRILNDGLTDRTIEIIPTEVDDQSNSTDTPMLTVPEKLANFNSTKPVETSLSNITEMPSIVGNLTQSIISSDEHSSVQKLHFYSILAIIPVLLLI